MALQIPFVRLLRSNDSIPSLLAEVLRRGKIRMTRGRDVFPQPLGNSRAGDQKYKAGGHCPIRVLMIPIQVSSIL